MQEDSTPLHYAAENGHLETVKVLLDKGADQTLRDRWRRSPMDLADSNRRYDVRLLLKEHVGTPLGIFNKAPPGSLTPGSSSMTPKVRLSALASVLPSFRSPHDMAATCVCFAVGDVERARLCVWLGAQVKDRNPERDRLRDCRHRCPSCRSGGKLENGGVTSPPSTRPSALT